MKKYTDKQIRKTNPMSSTKPSEISKAEWKEILILQEVKDAWGIENDAIDFEWEQIVKDFSNTVYGVKFDFVSGGPGYVGDLFILQGDALSEPMTIIRNSETKQLEVYK